MSSPRAKTIVLAFAALLLAGAAVLLILSGLCASTIQAEVGAPDTRYLARLEQSDCGAVTRFDTDVMVTEKEPRLGLQIFGHRRENVFTFTGASSHVKVYWEGPSDLVVQCMECRAADVHIWKTRWKGVSIRYVTAAADIHPLAK